MRLSELFQGILDSHNDLLAEYKRFVRYCAEKTGAKISFPKNKQELTLALVYYILRRNIVLARAKKASLAAAKE